MAPEWMRLRQRLVPEDVEHSRPQVPAVQQVDHRLIDDVAAPATVDQYRIGCQSRKQSMVDQVFRGRRQR